MIASLPEKPCEDASHSKALHAKSDNKIYSVSQELSERVRVLGIAFRDNLANSNKHSKKH